MAPIRTPHTNTCVVSNNIIVYHPTSHRPHRPSARNQNKADNQNDKRNTTTILESPQEIPRALRADHTHLLRRHLSHHSPLRSNPPSPPQPPTPTPLDLAPNPPSLPPRSPIHLVRYIICIINSHSRLRDLRRPAEQNLHSPRRTTLHARARSSR